MKKFLNYIYFRTDDLRNGRLVGLDRYGNKYYEDDSGFVGQCFELLRILVMKLMNFTLWM